MKSHIVLTILCFIVAGFCSDINNLSYDSIDQVCAVKNFRRKRSEYRRWKTNSLTSSEFLVKVLDDELTTQTSKKIVAINIQPITIEGEKIIVGGAALPSVTSNRQSSVGTKDYTRFLPPTTLPVKVINNELQLASQQLVDIHELPPIKPNAGLHSQRDDSPPASPQFLGRTPLVAEQFAPIAPVAFTIHSTLTPRKPPSAHMRAEHFLGPTRTSPIFNVIPTRTRPNLDFPEDFHRYLLSKTISNEENTKSIEQYKFLLSITSTPDFSFEYSSDKSVFEHLSNKDEEKNELNNKMDQDSEKVYNMIFYDDDEDGVNKTKEEKYDQDSMDVYAEPSQTSQNTILPNNNFVATNSTNIITTLYSDEHHNTERVDVAKSENSSSVSITNENLQSPIFRTSNYNTFGRRNDKICNLLKLREMNFNSPRTLPEVERQLKQWANNSPLVKMEDITAGNLTTMQNPIHLMMIEDLSSGQIVSAKQTVMIVSGIQGRDHHAVTAAMYVLYQLIERSSTHADLLSKYRFWVIPVFNPDGYDYSTTFPHQREWSKNLHQSWEVCNNRDSCNQNCELYGLRCTMKSCYGVNLDRNFEYQWIPTEELRAEHPCGPLYAGERQLSEAETRALTHFLRQPRTPLTTFIALKEGDVLGVMYPYSHTRKLRAFDHVNRQRASRAASAAYSISGRPYAAGQTSEFLPLYAGGIEDWVDGHLGIDNTYSIMMFRPTDSYNSKLVTERVVHEAYAALDTLLLQSVAEPLPTQPQVALKRTTDCSPTMAPDFIMPFITSLAMYINRFSNWA